MTSNTIYFQLALKNMQIFICKCCYKCHVYFYLEIHQTKCAYGVSDNFVQPVYSYSIANINELFGQYPSTGTLFILANSNHRAILSIFRIYFKKNILNITQKKCQHKFLEMEKIRKYKIYYNNSYFSLWICFEDSKNCEVHSHVSDIWMVCKPYKCDKRNSWQPNSRVESDLCFTY